MDDWRSETSNFVVCSFFCLLLILKNSSLTSIFSPIFVANNIDRFLNILLLLFLFSFLLYSDGLNKKNVFVRCMFFGPKKMLNIGALSSNLLLLVSTLFNCLFFKIPRPLRLIIRVFRESEIGLLYNVNSFLFLFLENCKNCSLASFAVFSMNLFQLSLKATNHLFQKRNKTKLKYSKNIDWFIQLDLQTQVWSGTKLR